MQDPFFWDNQNHAQKIIAECNELKDWTVKYFDLQKRTEDLSSILPDLRELTDEDLLMDVKNEIQALKEIIDNLEIKKMLSGELDNKNCYLSINAGAGGTEACDWVQMLFRMYERWSAKKKWKSEVLDLLPGEVAGVKSVTIKLSGLFAYGYAKAEKGVHRLVRISPFDSNKRRHTSFASVEITPEIEEDIEVDIKPDEIRVDTFRSSGAGGQHVNTTDSAVRVTHVPSGIIVSCQSERSQVQNKETCLKILRSKLYEKEVYERKEAMKEEAGEKKEIGWGSQIRNYVFHPYTLVKDSRTKFESGDIEKVMDGDLDDFVNSYLKEFG